MIAYASRTGTRRNLDVLRAHGWRLLFSAEGVYSRREATGWRYALDNGAWTAFQQQRPWDEDKFLRLCESLGDGADFVVVPDVVGDRDATLELVGRWLERLGNVAKRRLIAVQDGMTRADVESLLGDNVGLFVGGSTDWKLATLADWAALASSRGAWCHVGRVNTSRRIHMCGRAGVHSFDGTSVTRFSKNCTRLDNARRQTAWVF